MVHSISRTYTDDVNLDHMPEVVLFIFLKCKLFPAPSILYYYEGSHQTQPIRGRNYTSPP